MFRFLLAAVAVTLVNGASLSIVEPRMIGGKEISINDVPFQVSLLLLRTPYCGGVIITPTKVLTAAACMNYVQDYRNYGVRAGSNNPIDGGQLLKVLTVQIHPKYKISRRDYETSIIILKNPIDLSGSVKAVTFADAEPAVGEVLTITGWGARTSKEFYSDKLQVIQVPVVDKKTCASKLEPYMRKKLPATTFCAGAEGKTITTGDPGGPVTNAKKQLVGLSLYSPRNHPKEYPGLYVSINNPEIREFIRTNM